MDDFKLDIDFNGIFSNDISIDDILTEFGKEEQDMTFSQPDSSAVFSDGQDSYERMAFPDEDDYAAGTPDGYASVSDYGRDFGIPSEPDSEYDGAGLSDFAFDNYAYPSELSAEIDDEPEPDVPRRRRAISSMKDEARRFIYQMQSQKSAGDEEEPDEPLYGDLPDDFSTASSYVGGRYEYEPDIGGDDSYDYGISGEEYSLDDAAVHTVQAAAESEFAEDVSDEPDDTASDDLFDSLRELASSAPEEREYGDALGYDADPTAYSSALHSYRDSYVPSVDEPEIDSRFNLGGRPSRQAMTYGSKSVDLGADESYVQREQSGYNPSQWTQDYDDPLAETGDDDAPKRKTHKFRFGRKKKMSAAVTEAYDDIPPDGEAEVSGFSDTQAEPADYAENDRYGEKKKYSEDDSYFPPTFHEYVLSIFASLFLKIRGNAAGDTNQTMHDTEEDLGPELTPAAAAKYYGSFIRSMKLRLRISVVLLVILCYVSLGLPVPGMLKYLPVASAFCFALQSAIMLLALDVITTGVLNAFRLCFGADTLAVVCCLLTGSDALLVALSDSAAVHIPLCALSSLSVVGLLLSAFLSVRGLRKTLRVPSIGRRAYAVTGELMPKAKEITLLKSAKSIKGFVRRTEEAGPDESLYRKISPFVFLFALVLAAAVAAVKKSFSDFLFIFSAILIPSVPFASMLAFALPFFLGSSVIFKSGAAIAGWSGLCDIGVSKNLIVTDRDLFPESSITMEAVRIFADEDAQKVISYAGTMMSASGSSSAGCFLDLMDENGCAMKQVDGFEYLSGGGMKGIIDGHVVLCGSTDLMRLMNVRIPFRLTDKTTVLLAIDGILYGIFSLHYEPLPQVRKALVDLMRSNRHPVFAMADFNVNPEMLHNTFDIPTDGYDFPPYVERFELLRPADESKGGRISAVVCNEGLGPLTHAADVGRRMYMAIRINVIINAIAIAAGILTVFIRLMTASCVSAGFIFVLSVFWVLPVIAVSFVSSLRK